MRKRVIEMGIKKLEYYTIECDDCGCSLEEYTGPLHTICKSEEGVKIFANTYDWLYMGKGVWLCEECKKARGIV